ncbi:MAG: OmpA family protein, partial [Pseudomonadota bacterium]
PFPRNSVYTNWDLSADRANVARRLLVQAGLSEARIAAVIGRAATEPAAADPTDARNRRIAIKLLAAPPGTPGGAPPAR